VLLVIILKDSSLRRLHVSRTAASRIPCLEDSLPPDLLAWTLLALRTPVSRSPCLKVFFASRIPCLQDSLPQKLFVSMFPCQVSLLRQLLASRTLAWRTHCFEDSFLQDSLLRRLLAWRSPCQVSLPRGLLVSSPCDYCHWHRCLNFCPYRLKFSLATLEIWRI